MALQEIPISDLSINPFELIGTEWGLVTAGDATGFNTMTVSWGGMGVIWGKNVVTIYVRPQRYTKRFIDAAGRFTLSFYAPEHKRALGVLGTKSGRDGDKVARWGSRRSSSMTRPHSKRRAWFSRAGRSTPTTSSRNASLTKAATAPITPSMTITPCILPRLSTSIARSRPSATYMVFAGQMACQDLLTAPMRCDWGHVGPF